jgi:hypothetical protein
MTYLSILLTLIIVYQLEMTHTILCMLILSSTDTSILYRASLRYAVEFHMALVHNKTTVMSTSMILHPNTANATTVNGSVTAYSGLKPSLEFCICRIIPVKI